MSPTLIDHAILECLDLGLKKELEVPKHLAVLYGGLLMGNSALVEQHWTLRGTTQITLPGVGPPLMVATYRPVCWDTPTPRQRHKEICLISLCLLMVLSNLIKTLFLQPRSPGPN